jgi:hypothetical protein
MKTKHYLSALFLLLSIYGYSQTGIQCVECGGMNGNHKTTCSSYNRSSSGTFSSNKTSFEKDIMLNIFSTTLNNLFSNKPSASQSSTQDIEKARQQEAQRQQALAALLARQKQYNDSIAEAKHNRMMKDYKQLKGSGEVKFKTLDDDTWKPTVQFNCKISAFKGSVVVYKSSGQSITLSETQSADLAPGDWIATDYNSRLKLHFAFENGGEDIILGPKTAINIVTNEAGNHVPKLMKGDLYVVNNNVDEKLANTTIDLQEDISKTTGKVKETVGHILRKMEVRTPNAVCGVRGTEFTINVDEFDNTVVNVKNGIVDLTGNLINGTITLTAGTKGIVKGTGEIAGPLKFDEKQFDNWKD